ncbi:MAG: hypothetical protein K1Y01_06940 [Vicinamibacteria bacterium]|nr:hypothetical protein [Vicinamibacteria bacterium]
MPNKTKTKASQKPAVKTQAKKAAAPAAKAKGAKTAAAKARPAEKVEKKAKLSAADRAAAKVALKAQKKLLKIEKAKAKLEAKIAAKALAKEAKLALKRKMREGSEGAALEGNGSKGKGLNLLVAPKGKLKAEKPGRKVKAPKPTKGPQFPPGTVFLPDGFKSREEIQYLFRGAVACVRESLDVAAAEIRAKSEKLQPAPSERELLELARIAEERFRGAIEAAPPNRVIPTKRTFASLVERARARRREIGAFMRGLDLGKTEPSHLDTHSEASLQGLMEWGARLEMLADSREVDKPDFTQQHRVLDQLESTTEMLVVDVELTLRRYKDRMSARGLELSTLPV